MSPRRRTPRRGREAPPSGNRWADIVVAVITDGERVLVTRRAGDAHLGGLDEFPGGHRKPDETIEEACVREVKEEVGLAVRVVRQLAVAWHSDTATRLALTFFECACDGSTGLPPEAVLKRGARWVAVRELATLHFPPANRDVVRRLVDAASQAPPPPGAGA
jgi:A/G-specific adenine glycosylase